MSADDDHDNSNSSSPSEKARRKDMPHRGVCELPLWWMEVTPHFLLDLEDEQARQKGEERLARYYSEFVDEDVANGMMFDIDGNLIPKEASDSNDNNSNDAPKCFGGRNFKPGSPGWDPEQWGIDRDDLDFEQYQTGEKLPPDYITVMTNYAKATNRYRPVEDAEKVQLRKTDKKEFGRSAEKPAFVPAYALVKLRGTKRGQKSKEGVYSDGVHKQANKYRANSHRKDHSRASNNDSDEEEEENRPPPKRLVTPEPKKWSPPPPRSPTKNNSPATAEPASAESQTPAPPPVVVEKDVPEEEQVEQELVELMEEVAAENSLPLDQEMDEEVIEFEEMSVENEEEQAVEQERSFSPDQEQRGYHITDHDHDTPTASNQQQPVQPLLASPSGMPEPPLYASGETEDNDDGEEDDDGESSSSSSSDDEPLSFAEKQQQQFLQQERNQAPLLRPSFPQEYVPRSIRFLDAQAEGTAAAVKTPEPQEAKEEEPDEEAKAQIARKMALYYSELAEDDDDQGMMCDKRGNPVSPETAPAVEEKKGRWGSRGRSRSRKRDRTPEARQRGWRSRSADRRGNRGRTPTPDRGRSGSPNKRRAQSDRRRRDRTPSRRIFNWLFGRRRKRSKMFDGTNYQPGSNGWDPSDWGIDWTHQDYDSYLTGESLPPQYVSAMFNYAKKTNKSGPDDAAYLEAFLHNDLKKTMKAFHNDGEDDNKEKQQLKPREIGHLGETGPPTPEEVAFTFDAKDDDLMMEPGYEMQQPPQASPSPKPKQTFVPTRHARRGSSVAAMGLFRKGSASNLAPPPVDDGYVYQEGDEYEKVNYDEHVDYTENISDDDEPVSEMETKQQQPERAPPKGDPDQPRRGSGLFRFGSVSILAPIDPGAYLHPEEEEHEKVDYEEGVDYNIDGDDDQEVDYGYGETIDEEEEGEEEEEEEVIEEEVIEEEVVEEEILIDEEIMEEEIIEDVVKEGISAPLPDDQASLEELESLLAEKMAELRKIEAAESQRDSSSMQSAPVEKSSVESAPPQPAPIAVKDAPANEAPILNQQAKSTTVNNSPDEKAPAIPQPKQTESVNETPSKEPATARTWRPPPAKAPAATGTPSWPPPSSQNKAPGMAVKIQPDQAKTALGPQQQAIAPEEKPPVSNHPPTVEAPSSSEKAPAIPEPNSTQSINETPRKAPAASARTWRPPAAKAPTSAAAGRAWPPPPKQSKAPGMAVKIESSQTQPPVEAPSSGEKAPAIPEPKPAQSIDAAPPAKTAARTWRPPAAKAPAPAAAGRAWPPPSKQSEGPGMSVKVGSSQTQPPVEAPSSSEKAPAIPEPKPTQSTNAAPPAKAPASSTRTWRPPAAKAPAPAAAGRAWPPPPKQSKAPGMAVKIESSQTQPPVEAPPSSSEKAQPIPEPKPTQSIIAAPPAKAPASSARTWRPPTAKAPAPATAGRAWPPPSKESNASGMTVKIQPSEAQPAPKQNEEVHSADQTPSLQAQNPAGESRQSKTNGNLNASEPQKESPVVTSEKKEKTQEASPRAPWLKGKKKESTPGLKVWAPRKEETKKLPPSVKPKKQVPAAQPEFAKMKLKTSALGTSMRSLNSDKSEQTGNPDQPVVQSAKEEGKPKLATAQPSREKPLTNGKASVRANQPENKLASSKQLEQKPQIPKQQEQKPMNNSTSSSQHAQAVNGKRWQPKPNASSTAPSTNGGANSTTPAFAQAKLRKTPVKVRVEPKTKKVKAPWGKRFVSNAEAAEKKAEKKAASAKPPKQTPDPVPENVEEEKKESSPAVKAHPRVNPKPPTAKAAPLAKKTQTVVAKPASQPNRSSSSSMKSGMALSTPAPKQMPALGAQAPPPSSKQTAPWMKKNVGAPPAQAPASAPRRVSATKPQLATPAQAPAPAPAPRRVSATKPQLATQAQVPTPAAPRQASVTKPQLSAAAPSEPKQAAPWMKKKGTAPLAEQGSPPPTGSKQGAPLKKSSPAAPRQQVPMVKPQSAAPASSAPKQAGPSAQKQAAPWTKKNPSQSPVTPRPVSASSEPAATQPKKAAAGAAPWAKKSGTSAPAAPANGLSRVTPENEKPASRAQPDWAKNGVPSSSGTVKQPAKQWPPPATSEEVEEEIIEEEIIDEEIIEEEILDHSEYVEESFHSEEEIIEEEIIEEEYEEYEEEVIEEPITA